MTPVESSSIAAIDHDPDSNTLMVEFKTGQTYHYAGVPASAHAALMASKSKGMHFQAHIRGKFDAVRR